MSAGDVGVVIGARALAGPHGLIAHREHVPFARLLEALLFPAIVSLPLVVLDVQRHLPAEIRIEPVLEQIVAQCGPSQGRTQPQLLARVDHAVARQKIPVALVFETEFQTLAAEVSVFLFAGQSIQHAESRRV